MSTMNIYCSGGMGFNVGNNFIKFHKKNEKGFAEIRTYFIDTSESNLSKNIPDDMVYLVDGLDGSGKKRDSNYNKLSECSKEILHQFKPADVNVVLHSASGGSGSVIGPILASELLGRGNTTIVVMVGSTSSRIEADNTIKTMKSYEMISKKREKPVIAAYRENSLENPRGKVDAEIETILLMLAVLFSGDNAELDAADLKNFIDFSRVTSYTPKLSLLDFYSKEIILNKGLSIVSLVTLVDSATTSDVSVPVEYQAVGFIPDATKDSFTVELPIHGCIIAGYYNQAVDRLKKRLTEYDEAREVVVEKSIIDEHTEHTSEGLIF